MKDITIRELISAESLQQRVRKLGPTYTLLDKPSRRKYPVTVDYAGFKIPDTFIVGYGFDYDGRYRELPFVGTIE